MPLSSVQRGLDPGYLNTPNTQTLFFGERGGEEFVSWYTFDAAVNYSVPVLRSLSPFLKLDVRNVLNDDTQIAWSNTIIPITGAGAPLDSLGRPTTFRRSTQFGTARNNANFVTPREIRVSLGLGL